MGEEEREGVEVLEKGTGLQKTITIGTTRFPMEEDVYKTFTELRGIFSKINFSHFILDYKRGENKNLILKTFWFCSPYPNEAYWKTWLETDHASFHETKFGQLKEPLRDYSEERLKRWQEEAIEKHKKFLDKIECLYYNEKQIPEDFLNHF